MIGGAGFGQAYFGQESILSITVGPPAVIDLEFRIAINRTIRVNPAINRAVLAPDADLNASMMQEMALTSNE